MFLSSRAHLASPRLTIFNMIDRESQSMAAVLFVKRCKRSPGKILPGHVGRVGTIRRQGAVAF